MDGELEFGAFAIDLDQGSGRVPRLFYIRLIYSGGYRMVDNSRGKQANAVCQDARAPKEQEQAERRRFQDALEDDDVHEALTLLRDDKATRTENQGSLPRQTPGRSSCDS